MAAKRRGGAKKGSSNGRRAGAKGGAKKRGAQISDNESAASAGSAAAAGVPEAGVPPTRQGGVLTATGQAVRQALELEEIPKGDERGAPDAPEMEPDYLEGQAPQGLQAEPALFVSNGEVDLRLQPTAAGPQPEIAATREALEEHIQQRREEHQDYIETRSRTRDKKLSQATIDRLGHQELRAIGTQRGYQNAPEHGNRTTRTWFAKAQKEDEGLGDEEI